MAQLMQLLLAANVVGRAAGILQVFLTVKNLVERRGFRAVGIPDVDREDQRTLAIGVVKYRFNRRIGENAAIPIEFFADPYRRERRW